MTQRNIVVTNRLGLHARAAAQLVRTASCFSCVIKIERADGSASADAKSILSVLMLAAARGSQLHLTTDGQDETAAMDAVCQLFADNFGEQS